jgi:hypothetical protein
LWVGAALCGRCALLDGAAAVAIPQGSCPVEAGELTKEKTSMIDTNALQSVIAKTLNDKSVIHSSVKRVGKEPPYFDIRVIAISTHDNSASLDVVMGWQADEFVRIATMPRFSYVGGPDNSERSLEKRVLDMASEARNALRLKWFRRVEELLSYWGEAHGLLFCADYEGFEFGVGDGCIWGVLPVKADYL